jgi:hypothetical protein
MVSGQIHATTDLPPEKDSRLTDGRLGTRICLNAVEKRKFLHRWESNPGRPARTRLLYRLSNPDSNSWRIITIFWTVFLQFQVHASSGRHTELPVLRSVPITACNTLLCFFLHCRGKVFLSDYALMFHVNFRLVWALILFTYQCTIGQRFITILCHKKLCISCV